MSQLFAWRNPFRDVRSCALQKRLIKMFAEGGTLWPEAASFACENLAIHQSAAPRVLVVVAHPDDESECAAVIYKITHDLGGIVDQAIVTNGEAGFQWSAPAQAYYGLPLTDQRVARRHLPRIRKQEVLRAGRILGTRNAYFFDQKDTGFTFGAGDGMRAWNIGLIRDFFESVIDREEYDVIVTLLPTHDTHGHHKSVAILLLEAAARCPCERRPAIVGVATTPNGKERSIRYEASSGSPLARAVSSEPAWQFDRDTAIAGSALNYNIVVNWVIAEHKSQGMFQMETGRKRFECFWVFEVSGETGGQKWARFLAQFEPAGSVPLTGIEDHSYA